MEYMVYRYSPNGHLLYFARGDNYTWTTDLRKAFTFDDWDDARQTAGAVIGYPDYSYMVRALKNKPPPEPDPRFIPSLRLLMIGSGHEV